MAEDTIGTARIDVVVDTSQLEIAVQRAKNRTADMSTAAQQEYAKLDKAEKRRIDRLIDQSNTLNLSKEQQLAYNASLKTNGALLDDLTKRISRNTAAQTVNGLTAKQTAAALRGVPAQMTDIFVSLQGGQRPMTVLLQQGGQLKDMFGGIVPAAKALGGAVAGLVNPYTVAAGAAAALLIAHQQGAREAEAYNRALIMSGNYARRSAADLGGLAQKLDTLPGVTERSASKAIAAVVSTGRISGDQFNAVSKAVAEWSAATGESVDDVVARFVKLADDPVKAILELNKSQNFLKEETLKQIESLVEQGKHTDAVSLAFKTYADVLNDRAPKITQNLGLIELSLKGVKNLANEMWDAMLGIGRAPSDSDLAHQIAVLNSGINPATGRTAYGEGWTRQKILEIQTRRAMLAIESSSAALGSGTVDSTQRDREKKALEEWDRIALSNLSKREKLEREIDDIRAKGKAAHKDEAEIEEQIAQARARYKESLPKGSTKTDPTESIISRLRQQIALNEEQVKSEDKLTATERMLVSIRTELEKLGIKEGSEARQEIDLLLNRAKVSGEAAQAYMEEVKAKEQLARLNAQLAATEENQRRSMLADLAGIGRGGEAAEILRRQLDIHRQYEDGLKALRNRGVVEETSAWKQQEQALRESRDRMLEAERGYQEGRAKLMADWRVGANKAWEDYAAQARDVAGMTSEAFTTALGGMEDVLVKFVQTGKLSFSDLADSIIADLARIAARQAIVGMVGGVFGSASSVGASSSSAASVPSFVFPSAKGNVLKSAGLSAYSNQIVNKPTLFPFARGAGLMGEAGPEAIMPLKRTQGGRLGVEVAGGAASGDVRVEVINNGQPVAAKATTSTMPDGTKLVKLVLDAVADDVASGGRVAKAGKSRFGWKETI